MAGGSARARAQSTRDRAERMLASAEKWERGAEGERLTGELLDTLGPGWTVWHDLPWPGRAKANLDHVVVGPTGIFVVDSKNWTGSVTVRDGVLRQNGYRRDREVEGSRTAAQAVAALVPEHTSACHGLVCFVRDEAVAAAIGDVVLCSTPTLLTTLTARPVVLDAAQVAELAARLHPLLTVRSAPTPTPTPTTAAATGHRGDRRRAGNGTTRRRSSSRSHASRRPATPGRLIAAVAALVLLLVGLGQVAELL